MKRLIVLTFIFALFSIYANAADKKDSLLNSLSSIKTLSAEFIQVNNLKDFGDDEYTGKVSIKMGEVALWDYKEPYNSWYLITKDKVDYFDEINNQLVKMNAKDIKEKYINPPTTTSFAIMFLPTEGLYAEVCNLNIIEELQRKFNITVTGPSTTIAYINALRMGFQTLAIKKQTNEIGKFAIALNNELKIYAESIEKAIAAMDKAKTQLQVDVSKRANILSSKINNIITTYEKIQDSESEQENN